MSTANAYIYAGAAVAALALVSTMGPRARSSATAGLSTDDVVDVLGTMPGVPRAESKPWTVPVVAIGVGVGAYLLWRATR